MSASEARRKTDDDVVAADGTTERTTTEPVMPPVAASIGRQAGRGLRWALSGTVIGKLSSFAMSLVLARLLVPSRFGLFAIALTARQFAIHVNDMGVIAVSSQWRGRVEGMVPTGRFGVPLTVGLAAESDLWANLISQTKRRLRLTASA